MQIDSNQVHELLGRMGDTSPLPLNLYDDPTGSELERRVQLRQLMEDILRYDDRVHAALAEPSEYSSASIYTLANGYVRITHTDYYSGREAGEWMIEIRTPDTDWEDVTDISGPWHTKLRQELKVLALTKPRPEGSEAAQAFWA